MTSDRAQTQRGSLLAGFAIDRAAGLDANAGRAC
jgi:hypothetical protein